MRVEVVDTESGRVFRAPIGLILENGIPLNRGFGEQLALPLGQWLVEDTTSGYQLCMFEEATNR